MSVRGDLKEPIETADDQLSPVFPVELGSSADATAPSSGMITDAELQNILKATMSIFDNISSQIIPPNAPDKKQSKSDNNYDSMMHVIRGLLINQIIASSKQHPCKAILVLLILFLVAVPWIVTIGNSVVAAWTFANTCAWK